MHLNRFIIASTLVAASMLRAGEDLAIRPPAVPLVTFNPYLSIWSEADRLTDDVTRHWTRHEHPLVSLIRIDGNTFRLMGNDPNDVRPMPQVSVRVLPTRSIYEFDNGQVHVTMTFTTAALPHDFEALTRPLSYITWQVRSVDGKEHTVSIYDSTSSALVVNTSDQNVVWSRETMGALTALKVGSEAQSIFEPPGDDTRITWGYAYAAAPTADVQAAIGANVVMLGRFLEQGALPTQDDMRMPRPVNREQPVLAFVFNLGQVGANVVSRHMMVAYDEIYSVKFSAKKLQPYWRRSGATPSDMLQAGENDYARLTQACADFDAELMADMKKTGGERYAQICALAYRECLAANGIAADANKQPLMFTKENTSNGDIATVDVIFPMDPIWILLSPTLAKASIAPVLAYGASDHWRFPNAPHDLGTYPIARGTDDGGEQMPVEESGNILIICDAIAKIDGNADFVTPWWPKLTQWAQFLEQFGLDPENQLCTDDFMGHLAHNSNLSIKAVLALAAYADLCAMRGESGNAEKYSRIAKADADHWMKAAADGDHTRLAFDKPNTWSQKYNLVWDRILGLNVFPLELSQKEIAWYKKVMQRYGVPLDSRTRLTKTDWSIWSAALADNQADFEALVSPIYDYFQQTSARMPAVDSYITDNVKSDGMHARPVVGGFFIRMLTDPLMWKKWAARDKMKSGGWALFPKGQQITYVVPATGTEPVPWRYTIERPKGEWMQPNFDDSGWKQGDGGFGTVGPVHSKWTTDDIWVRREFTMPAGDHPDLQFIIFHDEDIEVFINGVPAFNMTGYNVNFEAFKIAPAARALLKPGAKITVAAHCHQTTGGQGIDIRFADVAEPQD